MTEKIKTEFKGLLRATYAAQEPEVMLSVVTPSATSFYTFQNVQCQFIQNVVLLVGVFTAVGVYFAVKSVLDKHYIKKVNAERFENISYLHEGIREVYLNRKRH